MTEKERKRGTCPKHRTLKWILRKLYTQTISKSHLHPLSQKRGANTVLMSKIAAGTKPQRETSRAAGFVHYGVASSTRSDAQTQRDGTSLATHAKSADDMITATSITLPPTLPTDKFLDMFRLACMHMRFIHPVLAVTIEKNIFNVPLLPCLLYDEIESFEQVEAWVQRAIHVHVPSENEADQRMEERIEATRVVLGMRPLTLSECTKEWHLVLSGHPDEQHKVGIMVYCAHTISDAHAELLVIRQQMEYLAKLVEAPWPLPNGHALHPRQLAWGSELDRLPRSLIEMLGVPFDAFDIKDAIQRADTVMKGYSLRLDEGRPKADPVLTETMHMRTMLSSEETSALRRATRAHGWSVTQVVDAARHMAYMEVRRAYVEKWRLRPIEELQHTDFLVPVDARGDFVKPFRDDPLGYAGNATGGFATSIPLTDPYFIPAHKELSLDETKPLHELSQVQVLAYVTEKLAAQYHANISHNVQRGYSATPLFVMSGIFLPTYPGDSLAPEGYSSVGILDKLLPRTFALPGHTEPIRVDDWFVSLVMSRHLGSLQFSFHIWSFMDSLHMSVIYTPHIGEQKTRIFLDTIRSTLKLFIMAYEQHGKPIQVPVQPPTPLVRTPSTLWERAAAWCLSWWAH